MKFNDIKPGLYFIYEGWIMLKIKPFRGYNTVILRPFGSFSVDTSEVTGTLTKTEENEEIDVIESMYLTHKAKATYGKK